MTQNFCFRITRVSTLCHRDWFDEKCHLPVRKLCVEAFKVVVVKGRGVVIRLWPLEQHMVKMTNIPVMIFMMKIMKIVCFFWWFFHFSSRHLDHLWSLFRNIFTRFHIFFHVFSFYLSSESWKGIEMLPRSCNPILMCTFKYKICL